MLQKFTLQTLLKMKFLNVTITDAETTARLPSGRHNFKGNVTLNFNGEPLADDRSDGSAKPMVG